MNNVIANMTTNTEHSPNWKDASTLTYEEIMTRRKKFLSINTNQENNINLYGSY